MPQRKRRSSRPAPALSGELAEALKTFTAGDAPRARAMARQVASREPANAKAHGLLAMCCVHLTLYDEALDAADRSLALDGRDAAMLTVRGRALRALDRTDEALESFARALELDPKNDAAAASMSQLLLALGRSDEARAVVENLESAGASGHQLALAKARLARHEKAYTDGVETLRTELDARQHPATIRAALLFLLADLLNLAGHHDEAFDTVTRAHALRHASFDAQGHARAIDRMIAAITRERYDKAEPVPPPDGATRPVFVLGMPRSGTTLIERVLGAHPSVHASGELVALQQIIREIQLPTGASQPHIFQQGSMFGSSILSMIARKYRAALPVLQPPKTCATDKLPGNILHIPIIAKALPDASIVLCDRDPRDTAVSCLFQNFGAAIPWNTSFETIAGYMEDARRAVDHFTGTLGIKIHRVKYESFVASPEPSIRELLDATGLPWDDACLTPEQFDGDARTRSAEQVREKINTRAVDRWRNYEKQLAPVMDRLEALA